MSAPAIPPNTGEVFYVSVPIDPGAFPPDADLNAEAREIARRYLESSEFLKGRARVGELEQTTAPAETLARPPESRILLITFRGLAR